MNREQKSKKLEEGLEEFFREHPELAEALRLFSVSTEQYRLAAKSPAASLDYSTNVGGHGLVQED